MLSVLSLGSSFFIAIYERLRSKKVWWSSRKYFSSKTIMMGTASFGREHQLLCEVRPCGEDTLFMLDWIWPTLSLYGRYRQMRTKRKQWSGHLWLGFGREWSRHGEIKESPLKVRLPIPLGVSKIIPWVRHLQELCLMFQMSGLWLLLPPRILAFLRTSFPGLDCFWHLRQCLVALYSFKHEFFF